MELALDKAHRYPKCIPRPWRPCASARLKQAVTLRIARFCGAVLLEWARSRDAAIAGYGDQLFTTSQPAKLYHDKKCQRQAQNQRARKDSLLERMVAPIEKSIAR